MITAESYEVLKFVEHGGRCRASMDCANGRLLIQRLKDLRGITKEQVFNWLKQLVCELDKYHRYKNGQCYRYLTPYSVLVTEEEKIMLLDLSAQSNGFVLKNMQTAPMRRHFVRPGIGTTESTPAAEDLYNLGKTMQFILAQTEGYISLSGREAHLLSGIIEKCLGENPKKKYANLKQVQKVLPNITCKQVKKQHKKTIFLIAVIILALAGVCTKRAAAYGGETGENIHKEDVYQRGVQIHGEI